MSTQHHLQGRENLDTLFAFDSGESTGSSLASGTPLGSPGRGAQRQARLGAVLQGRVAREGGSGREHLGQVRTGPGKLVEVRPPGGAWIQNWDSYQAPGGGGCGHGQAPTVPGTGQPAPGTGSAQERPQAGQTGQLSSAT